MRYFSIMTFTFLFISTISAQNTLIDSAKWDINDYQIIKQDNGKYDLTIISTDSIIISGMNNICRYFDAFILQSSDSIGYYSANYLLFPYSKLSCGAVSIKGNYGIRRNEDETYSYINVDGSEMFPNVTYENATNCIFDEGYAVPYAKNKKLIIDTCGTIRAKMKQEQNIELPHLDTYWKIGFLRMKLFSLHSGRKIYSRFSYNTYDNRIIHNEKGYIIGKKKRIQLIIENGLLKKVLD